MSTAFSTTLKIVPWRLLAITLLARALFALVVHYLDGSQGFFMPDTQTYVIPAQSLLQGSFSVNGTPEIVRTPGYPLLLIPAVASHHLVLIAMLENFLLAVVSAWLVWKIPLEFGLCSQAGWWAVLFYCVEPVGFLSSQKLLSDLFFTTQLLLFASLTIRFLRNPTLLGLIWAALSLSIATYTRPATLFLGFWLVPFFVFFPRQRSKIEHIRLATSFALLFAIVLAPWIIRNMQVAGYSGFSGITDVNLYFYSGAAVQAKLEHKSFLQVQQELSATSEDLYFRAHPEQRGWSQTQILQFRGAEGRRLISQHRFLYAGIHLRGCIITLFDPGAAEIMRLLRLYPESGGLLYRSADQGPLSTVLWVIWHYPWMGVGMLLLGAQLLFYYSLGFIGLWRLPLDVRVFFLFLFAYFVLVSGSANAVSRFRAPIMPFVCISAAAAIACWKKQDSTLCTASKSLPSSEVL